MPNSKKIKLLFIYQDLEIGGAEIALVSTVKNIDKKKYEINICCINKEGGIAEKLKKIGCNIIILNKRYKLCDIFTTFVLYKVIKRYRPDVVHTSLFYANYHGRIAAKLAGVPVIVSEEQCVDEWKNKYFIFMFLDKILSYVTDKIIACSDTVRDFVVKRGHINIDKITVIYNSFDIDRFKVSDNLSRVELNKKFGFNDNDKIIGTIGRLCEQKGHIYLIDAMKKVIGQIPEAKLLIVGEGPLEEGLKTKVCSMALDKVVFFMKKRYDVSNLLAFFDIFVLPSLWEGLSVALLEAMYMAKPIVVSDIPSNREVISDNETGIFIPPADSVLLADSIIDLLNNDQKKKSVGALAHDRVLKYFSPSTRISKIENLYEAILKQKTVI